MATYDLTQNLVTLINLIPDGDMESSSWTNGNYSTTEKKYGSRSQYFTSGTTRVMTKAMTTLPIVNHKYYGRHYLKTNGSVNADDCRFEWYAGDGDGLNYVFGWNRGNYTDWTMESNIITVSAVNGSSYQCRSFMVNPTGELWVDGLMIVDLTAAFGSGNEPTKDWCDTNIPFFIGTTQICLDFPSSLKKGDVLNIPYSGNCISFMLPKKTYTLQCWGARGGNGSGSAPGGAGGYSTGILKNPGLIECHVYTGGKGGDYSAAGTARPGGFNGGGTSAAGSNYGGGGGGGASDIRIGSNSLYARLIVAGSGGGGGYTSTYTGGAGGGLTGGTGTNSTSGTATATGGSQTAGGECSGSYAGTNGNSGSFGTGGAGGVKSSGATGGGGGAGWYGGAGGKSGNSSNCAPGGGGSGYVYTSSTASNYPSGCLLNNNYYLTETFTGTSSHEDDGYIRITVGSPKSYEIKNIYNFEYTGATQSMTLKKGVYKLECWGAQGGSYSSSYGGAGGYSCGILSLSNTVTVYIQVGGQPATNSTQQSMSAGGYNGGGQGAVRYYSSTYSYGQGGGGGTDIRIGQDSLYARVIVAGGGGGSSSVNALTTKYGGGTSGGSPTSGYAATQTNGGTAGTVGTFGVGANTLSSKLNYKYGSGGGGGGWYGGAAAAVADDNTTGYRGYNGGGSGYVYTATNASNYPSGCLLNSSYYLTDATTIAGNASFTNPDGSIVTGHTGNGYARITEYKVNNIDFRIKVDGDWVEVASAFVKVNGEWKEIVSAHTKINGAWTE